jgi:glycosyltransferase involved in cell wall biosynthesis
MDIAFVSNVVYPDVTGGAEKRIYEIARRLAAKGHTVTQYSRHYWDGPERIEREGVTYQAIAPGKELYAGDRRSIPEAVDFGVRTVPALARTFRDHDIVHASVFPYFPVLGAAVAKAAARGDAAPLVTTWHEVWLDYWEEYLGRLSPFGKLVERYTAWVGQHPIAISELTARRLKDLGRPREQTHIVPNGIDVEGVLTVTPAADGYDVLYAGRLIPEKNVDVTIEAFARAAQNDPDIRLGIIGDGPKREALERLASGMACRDRIDFLGVLPEYEDVLGHMHAADVFCSPSEREGFGITYIEALAAGCTVIGADHPRSAASEVIGDAGLAVRPTTAAVTQALSRSLSGVAATTRPERRAAQFDWDRIAAQTLDVYRAVLEETPTPQQSDPNQASVESTALSD